MGKCRNSPHPPFCHCPRRSSHSPTTTQSDPTTSSLQRPHSRSLASLACTDRIQTVSCLQYPSLREFPPVLSPPRWSLVEALRGLAWDASRCLRLCHSLARAVAPREKGEGACRGRSRVRSSSCRRGSRAP